MTPFYLTYQKFLSLLDYTLLYSFVSQTLPLSIDLRSDLVDPHTLSVTIKYNPQGFLDWTTA